VAILGSGGLGSEDLGSSHSVPNRMSFKAWTIGRGKDKRDTVKNLTLHLICNNMQHVLEELFRNGKEGRGGRVEGWAGGAKVIPATTPGGKAMESALGYGRHQRLG
jgi:hypothetical protein